MTQEQQEKLEGSYVMSTYARKPVEFVRGQGMQLFNSEGRCYLDFLAGIGAVSVGHCHPEVTAALSEQVQGLVHVGNYFYVSGRGELAKRLSDLLNQTEPTDVSSLAEGTDLGNVVTPSLPSDKQATWRSFFANSGTEAIEGAIKIARKHGKQRLNGAYTIITAQRSFHGRSMGALAATGQPVKQEAFAPMPDGFIHLEFNNIAALIQALDDSDNPPCAVMLECIQGEGGVWPHSVEYLLAVRAETAKRNIALIIDEVQTGFYRTGSLPFAFAHYGILPDIVTMAKGMGNGMPLGAVAARDYFGEVLVPGEHGSTFGGSPLAIAAANATIDVLTAATLPADVKRVGDYFCKQLASLPHIVAVRGKGLMIGADLNIPLAPKVVDMALQAGFVLNATGPQTLRFLPPLICEEQQVDELIAALTTILEGLS